MLCDQIVVVDDLSPERVDLTYTKTPPLLQTLARQLRRNVA